MRAGWIVCVVAWVCRFVADFEGACAKSLAGWSVLFVVVLSEVACLYVDFGGVLWRTLRLVRMSVRGRGALSEVVGRLERTVCGRLK